MQVHENKEDQAAILGKEYKLFLSLIYSAAISATSADAITFLMICEIV